MATAAESEVAYRAWLHMAKQHAFGKTGSSLRRKGGEGRRRRPEAGAGPSRARLARHVCQSLLRIVGNEAADAFAERSLPSSPLAVLRQLEAKRSAKLAGARVGGSYVLPAPAGQPMSSQDDAPYKPGLALPPLSPLRWPGALPVAIARPLAWAAPVGAKCTSNACLRQALTMGQIGGARVQVAPLRAHARPERVIAYSSALLKRPPCSDPRHSVLAREPLAFRAEGALGMRRLRRLRCDPPCPPGHLCRGGVTAEGARVSRRLRAEMLPYKTPIAGAAAGVMAARRREAAPG